MLNSKISKVHGYPSHLISGSEASAFLRLPQVLELIPVGKSTIYYLMAKGDFPKQVKLGPKLAVWRKSDIENYMSKLGGANE